jgi:hypothetical protein
MRPDRIRGIKISHESALNAAIEVIKVTITLATGTLVFSAQLLKEDVCISPVGKCWLFFSWVLLGCSIISGALAYARVPVMINEGKPNIKDGYFEWPGLIHHITFLGGVVVLGIAMTLILYTK